MCRLAFANLALLTGTLMCSHASAQHGLALNADRLGPPGRQPGLVQPGLVQPGRVQLGPVQLGWSLSEPGPAVRAQLFGDYFLTGPGFGQGHISGGLRLTTSLAIGPRRITQALPPLRLGESLRDTLPLRLGTDNDSSRIALPYLGLGYTSLSPREGWGFSADIGMGGLAPGERVRLGRSGPSAAQVESLLNDLRLSPVLQLGVSYAF